MEHRYKCKTQNYWKARKKRKEKLEKELEKILVSLAWVIFLDLMPKAQSMEEKNW